MTEEDVLALINERFASGEAALHWFEQKELPGFGGMTAKQLVELGRGNDVGEFVAALDAGVFV